MPLLRQLRPYGLIGLFLSVLLGTLLVAGGRLVAAPVSPAPAPISRIALTKGVQKTVLENGLTVLTKEVHTAPVVSVQVWYRVGSRNEGRGESGISHQLEHLMFKGTQERPVQFGRLFSALGSQFNAFTSYDQTVYFGTVERDKLTALLTLEADRMQGSVISPEHLDSEKRVVISELQGYENSPNYRLSRAVMRAAFPNRAYGLPVGGTKADVEQFTVEQVKNYYQTYYSPDNAVLVITGDFSTDAALQVVQQTFGKVPQRPRQLSRRQPLPAPQAQAKSNTPIVLKEAGSAALLQVVYPLPELTHPDVPAIDVLDAILTGGRSSRLYQALVESGLASTVGGSAAELMEPGWYSVSATAAPGQDAPTINTTLQKTLAAVRQTSVTPEELKRAKTQLRASLILSNQDITRQANLLGYNQTVADDYQFVERYLNAIDKVTAADVQRVAKTYLDPAKQTIGFFEPTQPDGKPGTTAAEVGRTTEKFSPGQPVDPAELARYLPPASNTTLSTSQPLPEQWVLPNGLRVLLLPDRSVPSVNLSGRIDAGTGFDPKPLAGLASLTANNLMNGTETQTALALAKALEDRGASLGFSANREGVSVNGTGLSVDLPVLLSTLADVLQHATFPADQVERSRNRALTSLKLQLDDPRSLARRVFQQSIYPEDHPFHSFPTEASLKRITRENLVQFYQKYYRPDTSTIAIVGDFDPAQVKPLLNQSLGQWQVKGEPPKLQVPAVALPEASKQVNRVIPGKAESVTYVGYNGIARKDPRYYAALVLNQILGGDTLSSRLGTEIRDRQGLTYGIYSAFATGIYPGPFLIQMQTAPGDTQKAVANTLALLQQVREQGVTQAELDNAKRSIASSYPVDLASPDSVADAILGNSIYGLSPEELREFPKRIEAVTAAEVQQVIQELIQPDRVVIVTAGPDVAPSQGR